MSNKTYSSHCTIYLCLKVYFHHGITRPKFLKKLKDVIVETENTKTKRSNGFDRIVKLASRQNVSKPRQKLPNLAAAAI